MSISGIYFDWKVREQCRWAVKREVLPCHYITVKEENEEYREGKLFHNVIEYKNEGEGKISLSVVY